MSNKKNNVLNGNELVTISILQQIKIELLTKKTQLQRNGAALEEAYIEDEPQEADYIDFVAGEESSENAGAGTTTFEQLIEEQLNVPSPIEELIDRTESVMQATFPPENKPSEETQQAQTDSSDNATTDEQKPGKVAKWIVRFNAWLVARSVWRHKKAQLDYEHERLKTDVANTCAGIDFAIQLIDDEIDRQRTGTALKVEEAIKPNDNLL